MSANLLIKEIKAKSILNKTGIPGMTYCINPYTGCSHGCIYCYATFMKDYSGHTEEWGDFVDVKVNLPEILSKEVKKKKLGRVCIGTVADAYQPIEQEKKLTRRAIEILVEHNFPFEILTKSSLVSRDIDLLKGYKNCSVDPAPFDKRSSGTTIGFKCDITQPDKRCGVEISITTIDDNVRKVFEPNADTVENRLTCVRQLILAGIETNIFFGPVLPYFSDNESSLNSIFETFKSVGVKRVLVDKLNYRNKKVPLILEKLKNSYPEAISYYRHFVMNPNGYESELRQKVIDIAKNKRVNVEVVF